MAFIVVDIEPPPVATPMAGTIDDGISLALCKRCDDYVIRYPQDAFWVHIGGELRCPK